MHDLNSDSAFESMLACEISPAPIDVQHTGRISVSSNVSSSKDHILPVFRLPAETLESIFIYCARDYYYRDDNSFLFRGTPYWVHVSYVCRRWRSVSLNCPILWTYLFDASSRWTEELLSRSNQAPLKLCVDMNFWPDTYHGLLFVEQVMTHIGRLEELCIRLPFIISDHQLLSILSSPAPSLRNLTFLSPYLSSSNALSSSVPFSGDTPALRTLKLTRCALPWHSLKLNGLTTLDLSYLPSWKSYQQTIGGFLFTLRCMDNLMHLYLEHAVASAGDFLAGAASCTTQKINLPHLSHLFISAPLSTLVALLSCINFPSETEVRLGCQSEYHSTLDDCLLLSSLSARRFQSLDAPAIHSLIIKFDRDKITFTFSSSEHACDAYVFAPRLDWGHDVPMQLFIEIFPPMEKKDLDYVARDICFKMSLTSVGSAHAINPPLSSSFWSEMLGCLPQLRYLKLSQGFMPDLTPALSPIRHGDAVDGELLAPMLEELELDDITFKSPSLSNPSDDIADADSLFDLLSARKNSRGQLTMRQCAVGRYRGDVKVDMIGKWRDGQFLVIEERRRPGSVFGSENSESDSESLFGSLDGKRQ